MDTVTAQALYDWVDETNTLDGRELHTLFAAIYDGDPSPSGGRPLPVERLRALAIAGDVNAMVALDGLGFVGAVYEDL